MKEIRQEGVHWIHVAQDRDQCQALVNQVNNFWIPYNVWNFWLDEEPLAFQDYFYSMEWVSEWVSDSVKVYELSVI